MCRPRKLTAAQESRLRRLIERARNRANPFTWKELQHRTRLGRTTLWRIWRRRPAKDRRVLEHLRPGQRRRNPT
jgi:hypothetical protein